MLGKRKRVFLADRHPVFRHGLIHLINGQPDLVACGETDNAHAALPMIDSLHPDLVATDLMLKQSNGLQLIRSIRNSHSDIPVLVLSTHEEFLYAEEALRAGARGFIMKQESAEEIVSAVRRVLSGRIYLSPVMGTKLLAPITNGTFNVNTSPIERLSDRERQVLKLLGEALETRQIAQTLGVSVKTVETYREHLKLKLNLDNSVQLIRKAVEWLHSNPSELPDSKS